MKLQAIILAGVAGCGKTSVGGLLASQLGRRFVDADDHHSAENKAKMEAGIALTDDDRGPWLETLARVIREAIADRRRIVLACSALRRAHRDALRVDPGVEIFLIHVPEDEIVRRLRSRTGHFFNPNSALIRSQFQTLEFPQEGERVIVIDGRLSPDQIAYMILINSGIIDPLSANA